MIDFLIFDIMIVTRFLSSSFFFFELLENGDLKWNFTIRENIVTAKLCWDHFYFSNFMIIILGNYSLFTIYECLSLFNFSKCIIIF